MIYTNILFIIASYLLGSLSSAIIIAKLMGLTDPRTTGSQNPGATNMLRIGGKSAAVMTLVGDLLKGFIPVFLAKWWGVTPIILSLIAVAAFLGHLYPVFFRFAGGKGVATLIGCLLALSWEIGCAFLLVWLFVALLFRYSSLAALTATLLAPFFAWYFTNPAYTLAILFMGILLFYRHRQNIQNLLRGTEKKLGR